MPTTSISERSAYRCRCERSRRSGPRISCVPISRRPDSLISEHPTEQEALDAKQRYEDPDKS